MQNLLKQFAGRDFASFERRLRRSLFLLTLFYSLTFGVLLLVSASVTYSAFSSKITERYKRFPAPPGVIVIPFGNNNAPTADEVREDLIISLILVNSLLLFVAVGAGNVLARLTLYPLKQSYDDQRRFIADASHELRTPLAVMRMELENEIGQQGLPKDAKEKIESHIEEVDRMTKIVKELLLLSRFENQQNATKVSNIDIGEMIEDIQKRLVTLADSYEVTMSFEKPAESVFIKGNGQVSHILSNVIQNAIIYNKPKGSIVISIKSESKSVVVSIRDTGIGMSVHDLEHIFDRFYRADKSRSRAIGGSGLGLSIAEHGIESLGGTISFESELGEGTTAYVTFKKA